MRTLVRCLLVVIGLAGCAPARADETLEEGPGYFVVRMDPNAGGAVYVRVDYSATEVRTTLLAVEAAPGWSYKVGSAGGSNAAVEVRFESRDYQLKFKALFKPGRTVIDYGELKKR